MKLTLSQAAEIRLGRQRAPHFEVGDHQTRYLRSANISLAGIDLNDVKSMNFTPAEQAIFGLAAGDVLVTEGSGSRDAVGVSAVWRNDLDGVVCFQNTVLRLRPRTGVTDGRYLAWWARHAHGVGLMAEAASGANILHLGADGLRRLQMHVPPISNQRRIADYLDDQVSRIDRIIAARRTQIALAAEAYTAELDDRFAAMPAVPLRRFLRGIEQGWSPTCLAVPAEPGQTGVIKLGAVRSGEFRADANKALPEGSVVPEHYILAKGDLLVSRANTPTYVGDAAVVAEKPISRLLLCDLMYRLRLHGASSDFVSAALRTTANRGLIATVARGTSQTMVKLRGEDIADLPVPDLPMNRQVALAQADIDARRALAERTAALTRSMGLLTEYKQSLITAAVTGGIDVSTASDRGVPA